MDDGSSSLPLAVAMRKVWAKGYDWNALRADVQAGLVVGIVAIPLSMALAIAVGAPPQHGLYTAIVAGAITALLGGCKFQITGPTAAFIVILAPILTEHGLPGLLTAGMLAGVMLVIMGFARMGALIKFIPYPVTTGFTTGIGTVIAVLQLKDFFGLKVSRMPEHFHEKVLALWDARATGSLYETGVAVLSLTLLLLLPRVFKRIPAPLIMIVLVSALTQLLKYLVPGLDAVTIGSRFHTLIDGVEVYGIPPIMPHPALPWTGMELSFNTVRSLLPAAFAIALLGAIESLLSAVIADGMTGTRHHPNSELIGLGVGNIVAPLFGGIAATGALARTATNIRSGARSPVSGVVHSGVILLSILFLAPLVAYIPMASLAALLLLVAWNMSEVKHFMGLIRISPRSDISVLLVCYFLTVIFDMVWAISVGFMLAAVLFMRRMSEITEGRMTLDTGGDEADRVELPRGVSLYEVNGPLFFGAAQNAMEALHSAHGDAFHTLILNLGRVSVIDATGYAALENTLKALHARGKKVILAGPLPRPARIWERAQPGERFPWLSITESLEAAVEEARRLSERRSGGGRSTLPGKLPEQQPV